MLDCADFARERKIICRLCANKSENIINIFEFSPGGQDILDKINKTLPIKASIFLSLINTAPNLDSCGNYSLSSMKKL